MRSFGLLDNMSQRPLFSKGHFAPFSLFNLVHESRFWCNGPELIVVRNVVFEITGQTYAHELLLNHQLKGKALQSVKLAFFVCFFANS